MIGETMRGKQLTHVAFVDDMTHCPQLAVATADADLSHGGFGKEGFGVAPIEMQSTEQSRKLAPQGRDQD